jgi:hypothetical protein
MDWMRSLDTTRPKWTDSHLLSFLRSAAPILRGGFHAVTYRVTLHCFPTTQLKSHLSKGGLP